MGAKPAVLVLDAELRHALAIVRSLGRQGVPVVVASEQRHFAARYSRYATASVILRPGSILEGIGNAIHDHAIQVVIAAGLPGNAVLCENRHLFEPSVRAPFNDASTFRQLSNKHETVRLAEALGVPHPRSLEVRGPDDVDAAEGLLGWPLVFKSPIGQGTTCYPSDAHALRSLVDQFHVTRPDLVESGVYPQVQQYVRGVGHGFYGLADHGCVRDYFMHRRLHEVPATGGASAMAMSWRDPALRELGERFFSATGWHGVAMVEFKRSLDDGRYYLIEVNPKFWGSLDLSISAGIDFPFLLYRMLLSAEQSESRGTYRDNVVFRWLTMDLAYAVETRKLRSYIRAFGNPRIDDDFDRRDPFPSAALFALGIRRTINAKRVRSNSGDELDGP